ncbi:MAG TPA: SH3 domain-containing protein [Geomonas sp.]
MRLSLLITLTLLVLCAASAHAAPPRPRPYSGCGVLALRQVPGSEKQPVAVYAEPGLQRIAELEIPALPRLGGSRQEPLVAVSAGKGGWLRLCYDDAGREGWTELLRRWDYLPWQEFLPGRTVRMFPGMKKGLYTLRGEPREGSPERGILRRDQAVLVLQVEDDWARLQSPPGWLRWRDRDGRLTVSP